MAGVTKLLLSALLLIFFLKVNGQRCDLSDVQIAVTNNGQKFRTDTVFEVEVKNLCRCTLTNVYVSSEGFASSMNVDPKAFRRDNADYLVNDGQGISPSASFKFQYAWVRPFNMSPSSIQVACSR